MLGFRASRIAFVRRRSIAAQFSGQPETIWITSPQDDDRKMMLIKEFWFEDRSGHKWITPAEYLVDGASIPRPLWSLVGSPYTGQYRRASIVHDKACDDAVGDDDARRAADRMFFEACRAGGCNISQSMILYVGVRIGSAWNRPEFAMAAELQSSGPMLISHPHEKAIVKEYQFIGDRVTRQGETDDPFELERRVDEAEQQVDAARAAFRSI